MMPMMMMMPMLMMMLMLMMMMMTALTQWHSTYLWGTQGDPIQELHRIIHDKELMMIVVIQITMVMTLTIMMIMMGVSGK